jgi:ABC-type transporter Mla subunit MlaD
MLARTVFGVMVMMFVLVQAANAGGKDDIQKYFNDTATKVKTTTNPAEKRAILNKSLQTMNKALDKVQSSRLISKEDRAGIDQFRTVLQENQDELNGRNGYEPVSDGQLNAFSDYVVQNMEQADRTITISLVTALLIVIIIILLV